MGSECGDFASWIGMSEGRLEIGAPLAIDEDDIGMGDGKGLEAATDPEGGGTRFSRFLSFGARFATSILTFSASLLSIRGSNPFTAC